MHDTFNGRLPCFKFGRLAKVRAHVLDRIQRLFGLALLDIAFGESGIVVMAFEKTGFVFVDSALECFFGAREILVLQRQ